MTRPLRIEFVGALYHVMSRGNERKPIVRDDRDRDKRLDWYRRTVETYGWHLHAFCLMTNHDHLFLETPEPNLSLGMQYLNGSYVGYFNARHRRHGHLFQGRFKAHLIEQAGHYQEISRYIHLNPVRANLVERPQDYFWSSYSSYRGFIRRRQRLDWVRYDRVLSRFGPGESSTRRRRYRRFVEAGIDDPPSRPWSDAVDGLLVGSEPFVNQMRQMLSDRPDDAELPSLRNLRPRPTLEQIADSTAAAYGEDRGTWTPGTRDDSGARAVAAYLARRIFGYAGRTVAAALGYRHSSSVSRSIRKVEATKTMARIAKQVRRDLEDNANH